MMSKKHSQQKEKPLTELLLAPTIDEEWLALFIPSVPLQLDEATGVYRGEVRGLIHRKLLQQQEIMLDHPAHPIRVKLLLASKK